MCQTESRYVQTVPAGTFLCPDPPRRKVTMSRLSWVQNFSCVHRAFKSPQVQTFVYQNCLCPDFRAFKGKFVRSKIDNLCVHVQTIVRSKDLMSRFSCVQNCLCPDFRAFKGKFVRSKIDNLCVHVQTIVRSKGLMSRLSCVQKCLCPDFCVFHTKNRPLQNSYSVRFCRGYPAFKRLYVETLVRSKWPMPRLLSVPNQNSRTETNNCH